MYKVLIVDDEKFVVSLIEKLVDWRALNMEVIGSANNGRKGIELVEGLKPDILIADVLMPGYDGITLMKKVREIDRDIKVIMISGHKRFEYAKSAMKYNVEDYLLKPIDKVELEGLLEKIKKEIDARQQQREQKNKLHEKLGENKILMNALFMEHLISGELFEKDTERVRVNEMYFTDFQENEYCCLISKINHSDQKIDQGFLEDTMLSASKKMSFVLGNVCDSVLSFIDYYRMIFLISYPNGAKERVVHAISEAASTINELIAKHSGFKQVLGIGKKVTVKSDMMELQESVETAKNAIDARFFLEHEEIIDGSMLNMNDHVAEEILTEEAIEALKADIRSASAELIRKRVSLIFDMAQIPAQKDAKLYVELVWRINQELYRYIRLFEDTEVRYKKMKKELRRKIEQCTSVRELAEMVPKHILDCIEDVVGDHKGNLSPAVRAAKKYIKSNYKSSIGLKNVADVANLSPVYFSILFKRETGANFVDYLNKVRIDAAKEMLRNIKYSIGDIAQECGFLDTRYFSKIFKKFVGITPSDYRNRQV